MANTTIKTRIMLRNDTLEHWLSSGSVELAKGEVAIATLPGGELAEVRIGTGSSTYADSLKLNIGTDQVSGLTDLISSLVGEGAKEYKVISTDTNSWKLQQKALSGGDWSDVEDSSWTVDFSAINDEIDGLTADVDYLSGVIDDTRATLDAVSSDYLKASDFSALSNEIGLSAATSSNKVVTQQDIADLAGAMHFVGPITLNDGETVAQAVARLYPDHTAVGGDIVIDTATSKEYLYTGSAWIELGDEVLYATKAELDTAKSDVYVSAVTSANSYTDSAIEALNISDYALSADVDTRIKEAKDYADAAISALDVASDEAGNADAGFVTTVTETDGKVAVTKKTLQLSDITDVADISSNIGLSDYALSADVTQLVSDTSAATIDEVVGESTDLSSADTIYGAKAYTDDKFAEFEAGFLVLDCGNAGLRDGEPEAPLGA